MEAGPAAESTPRPSSDADAGESPPEAAGGGRGSGAGTHGRSVEGMSREPEPRPTLPPAEVARLADLLLRGCPGGDLKALREVGRANKAWVDGSLHKRCPSPLHVAAQVGHDAIVNALLEEFHADVNSTDGAGMTPLHTAAEYGNVGVVRLLLHSPNIRPNAQDDFGWTPLHYAACCLKVQRPGPAQLRPLLLPLPCTVAAAVITLRWGHLPPPLNMRPRVLSLSRTRARS